METTQRRIAVLGTGIMGRPMAANLCRAGFAVTAWNRTRAKAEPLAESGVRIAESPAEAVAEADTVITMLENGPVVTEVLFGSGAAAASPADTLFIDMSSILPSTARDHANQLAAQQRRHLDAPVSGGEPGAIAGTLAIMAGGSVEDFAAAQPIFAALGRAIHVGPSGSGQLAKLANQAIVGITIGAVAEALLLAAAGGADPAAVRDAITGGFADSRVLQVHGARMLERDFVPGGAARIHLKDLDGVLTVAGEIGLELPLTQRIRDGFAELTDRLDGAGFDHSAILLWLESLNRPHRVGQALDRLP